MFFPIPAFRSFRQWMDTSSAFVRAWVRSPRSVGMVCPSGMPLARSMAAFAPRKGDGLVVELGAGTGTVTRQLLDAGIAPRRLVVVEQSPVMVSLLRERFPQLAILEADARWLADCLPRDRQVDCIVSSLPLLSLNERVRNQIISAMFEVLHEGGLLIQYTYSWRKANAFLNVLILSILFLFVYPLKLNCQYKSGRWRRYPSIWISIPLLVISPIFSFPVVIPVEGAFDSSSNKSVVFFR